MDAKILVFANCVEAIIYLLLYNLHDCTFEGFHQMMKFDSDKYIAIIDVTGVQ